MITKYKKHQLKQTNSIFCIVKAYSAEKSPKGIDLRQSWLSRFFRRLLILGNSLAAAAMCRCCHHQFLRNSPSDGKRWYNGGHHELEWKWKNSCCVLCATARGDKNIYQNCINSSPANVKPILSIHSIFSGENRPYSLTTWSGGVARRFTESPSLITIPLLKHSPGSFVSIVAALMCRVSEHGPLPRNIALGQ